MTTIKTFVQKFTNDWSTNLASVLTYSLITAIFPILAAILITLLFPTYIKVFLHGNARYGATVLTVLVLIAWLWFFAIILMIGAQINAMALGLKPLPNDVARYIAADYAADRTASSPHPQASTHWAPDAEMQRRSDESGRSGRGLAST